MNYVHNKARPHSPHPKTALWIMRTISLDLKSGWEDSVYYVVHPEKKPPEAPMGAASLDLKAGWEDSV